MYCQATFNYMGQPVELPVLDGRQAVRDFEVSGFTLLAHESSVTNWNDQARIDEVHGPEIEKLARAFVGCDVAMVYPSLLRNPDVARQIADYAPISFVHSDFTEDYGSMILDEKRPYHAFLDPLLDRYGMSRADLKAASRTMMLQFWRNTGPVQADEPLAFCDARDIGPSRQLRFVVPEYGGQHLEFETFGFSAPTGGAVDRWYTFPHMRRDEVVAFRTYDSACIAESRPFWTPHSAFRDPNVPDSPEHRRASVEMRALCLWH